MAQAVTIPASTQKQLRYAVRVDRKISPLSTHVVSIENYIPKLSSGITGLTANISHI